MRASFNNQNNQFVKRRASRYLFIHPQYAVRLIACRIGSAERNTALIKVCRSNQLIVITCRCVSHRDPKLPTLSRVFARNRIARVSRVSSDSYRN